MNDLLELLTKFSNAHGVSGYEDNVSTILSQELMSLVDDVRMDTMGNVIGTRAGDGPKVMVAAHMDEIGLMVSHITSEGFLRIVPVGGWFDQTLLSQRVLLHTRKGMLPAVVGSKPPHLMDAEESKKIVKIKDMFLDCGAVSDENAAEMGIEIGSPVTIDRELKPMGNDFVTGKALDNRAGLVMLVTALRRLKDRDVKATIQAVGTVQEEVGLKGARTSAYGLDPDVALATDVTIPGDHPGVGRAEANCVCGDGPVIAVLDASGRGIIAPRPVLNWLRRTAESEFIPYQLGVGSGGTTDATAINLTKSGIPCSVISVPTRYIHSPVEVLSLADLDQGANLIAAAIASAHQYF